MRKHRLYAGLGILSVLLAVAATQLLTARAHAQQKGEKVCSCPFMPDENFEQCTGTVAKGCGTCKCTNFVRGGTINRNCSVVTVYGPPVGGKSAE